MHAPRPLLSTAGRPPACPKRKALRGTRGEVEPAEHASQQTANHRASSNLTRTAARMGPPEKVLSQPHVSLIFLGRRCKEAPLEARNETKPPEWTPKASLSFEPPCLCPSVGSPLQKPGPRPQAGLHLGLIRATPPGLFLRGSVMSVPSSWCARSHGLCSGGLPGNPCLQRAAGPPRRVQRPCCSRSLEGSCPKPGGKKGVQPLTALAPGRAVVDRSPG